LIGRADGQFVSMSKAIDKIIEKAGGNTQEIAKLLGTRWSGQLYRVDIPRPLLRNARFPSGLESGADPVLFRWGGYTSGGQPEAVIDPIPTGEFTTSPVTDKTP
jgi:hypothetical protein